MLYRNDDLAKKEFHKLKDFCNCSAHKENKKTDRPHHHHSRFESSTSSIHKTLGTKVFRPKFKGMRSRVREEDNEDSDSPKKGDRKKSKGGTRQGVADSSSPCRRSCSTIHNPVFHVGRCGKNSKPGRPKSADKVKDHMML